MSTEGSRILTEVLALPMDERAELVDRILESPDETPDKERLERWAAETESRLDAIDRGELETRPGDEVFADLRRRYS
jgi:putative addiction module component (TIGR02574 family)